MARKAAPLNTDKGDRAPHHGHRPDDDERSALALWLEVPDLPEAYEVTFLSDSGKLVLRDLARIAAATKVDASNPNPNSAIYRCAQLDLLRRIHNMAGIRPSEE